MWKNKEITGVEFANTQQEKTQITFLHLPEKHWEIFIKVNTNLDEQLVSFARERFDEILTAPPVGELTTDDSFKRCSFPLGMDNEGNFHPLDE